MTKQQEELLRDILEVLEKHKDNGVQGYDSLGSEYWFGILTEATDVHKDILALYEKYGRERTIESICQVIGDMRKGDD